MADRFQFASQSASNLDLEHYRIEIRKLKVLNQEQRQAYEAKIRQLEAKLKQTGEGTGRNPYNPPSYTSAGTINAEIVKRDKEISRLAEEIERYKKQLSNNPDRELFVRNKNLFDDLASKDAQIAKLKRTIYQLESKYDGKYFNDSRTLKQYEVLVKQNQKLRKQLEAAYDPNGHNIFGKAQLNNSVLEGLKYKKEYDLASRENQYLKNQLAKIQEEHQMYKKNVANKTGGIGDAQVFKKQNMELKRQIARHSHTLRSLRIENEELKNRQTEIKSTMEQQRTIQNSRTGNLDSSALNGSPRKHHIFSNKSLRDQNRPDEQPVDSRAFPDNELPANQLLLNPQRREVKIQPEQSVYQEVQIRQSYRQPAVREPEQAQSLNSEQRDNLEKFHLSPPSETSQAPAHNQETEKKRGSYYSHLYIVPRPPKQ